VNPAERHFDAYMTWTNYADESRVDATEFIVNGKHLGSGRDGYLAAVAELRRLPVGAAVVIFPAYHWAIFSNIGRPHIPPYAVYSDTPLADAIKDRQLKITYTDRDMNGRIIR
jgi:hypothetical protein